MVPAARVVGEDGAGGVIEPGSVMAWGADAGYAL